MANAATCPDVNGASNLQRWFGEWPTFHDAEVVEIRLSVETPSLIRLRTWKTTGDVDSSGHLARVKQVVVSFELRGVFGLELFEFGNQNVLNGVLVSATENGHRIDLEQLHGVGGWVAAREIAISFTPEAE